MDVSWDDPSFVWMERGDGECNIENSILNSLLIMPIICVWLFTFPISAIFLVNIGDISTDAQWFIGNVGQYGYYRVNYDIENWEALLQQLSSDHQVGCLFLTPALK